MVIWLPPDFHKNGYKKSAWICSYPCARWLVFGFARVQISRFRQNRRFSSVILPLCFLTVKTAKTPIKSGFSVGASILCNPFGGECGIRTHVGVSPNGFQDRLVMTASITLRIFNLMKNFFRALLRCPEKSAYPLVLDFSDRCATTPSLLPPQAALRLSCPL